MVNPDVLHRRLKKLDEYLDYLGEAQRYSSREFADNPERVFDVLQNQLDSFRGLRRVFAHFL